MNKYPSENQLKLAGWLSLGNGLGSFPSNAILIFALFSENPPLTAAAIGVQVGLIVAAFFVYLTFIRLLNGPLQFHRVTLILWMLAGILGLNTLLVMPVTFPYRAELFRSMDVMWIYFSISFVTGMLYVVLGFRLRALWVKLPSTNFCSIASLGMGLSSLLFLLGRWIPEVVHNGILLTFLAKGIFDIALALVFFEAAGFARSDWQTASTDGDVRPDGEI